MQMPHLADTEQAPSAAPPSGPAPQPEAAGAVPPLLALAWRNHKLGKLDEAQTLYLLQLETTPADPELLRSLGILAHDRKQFDDAIALLECARDLAPDNEHTYANLAGTLLAQGNHEAAIACYRTALARFPGSANLLRQLGIVLHQHARYAEAVDVWRQALDIAPDDDLHVKLGSALSADQQTDEAIAVYRQALEHNPDLSAARLNLANALVTQVKLDEAMAHCQQLVDAHPEFGPAWLTRGNIHVGQDLIEEAIQDYARALELIANHPEIHANLGNVLGMVGRNTEAWAAYKTAYDHKPTLLNAHVAALFNQHYDETRTPAQNLAEAVQYGRNLMAGVTPFLHRKPDAPRQRLRIGFVSGDLRWHPVSLFLENVVKHLDVDKLELHAYSLTQIEDAVTERLKPCFTSWTSLLGQTPKQSAERIRDDGIDILVDLAGHTTNTGLPLFAWKPAPIQLSWIGYFASTGVPTVDYFLGDRFVLPENEAHHFTEQAWHLPNGYLCFNTPSEDVAIQAPPSEANGYVTFGCFNNLRKVNASVIAVWARVLHAVPGSRLLLKARELRLDYPRRQITECFAQHGIEADRLILEGPSSHAGYLDRYNQVDIALDPFPYNGGTTTVETIWMGVPVVVLKGDRFVGHMGEGILHHLGHPEWIAADEDAYVAFAQALSNDVERRAGLRSTLRDKLLHSPLCDGRGFARQLETAFEDMWRIHCERASDSPEEMIDALLARAVEYQHEHAFELARALYRDVLRLQPNHVEANHNLGLMAVQQSRATDSLPFFKIALEAAPKRAELWALYIDALNLTGHADAARQARAKGLQLGLPLHDTPPVAAAPSEADILAREFEETLTALSRRDTLDSMLAVARQMTRLLPDHGLGWKAAGSALVALGQLDQALEPLTIATRILPDDAELKPLLGRVVALHQAEFVARELDNNGDSAGARAIRAQLQGAGWNGMTTPSGPAAGDGLANLTREQRAALLGEFVDTLAALLDTQQFAEAEAIARQLTALLPEVGAGWHILATALRLQGKSFEALEPLRHAYALLPNDQTIRRELAELSQ